MEDYIMSQFWREKKEKSMEERHLIFWDSDMKISCWDGLVLFTRENNFQNIRPLIKLLLLSIENSQHQYLS